MKRIILALISGLAFAASPLTSDAEIGLTTASQLEATYGKPILTPSGSVDFRIYVHGNSFIGVVYDTSGICQGIAYYKLGNDGFSRSETNECDYYNLPGGSYSWTPVPTAGIPNSENFGNLKMWMTVTNSRMMFEMGGSLVSGGMPLMMRAYATVQGCLLLGNIPPADNWGNDVFNSAPKQRI